jgi:hypothetical protein
VGQLVEDLPQAANGTNTSSVLVDPPVVPDTFGPDAQVGGDLTIGGAIVPVQGAKQNGNAQEGGSPAKKVLAGLGWRSGRRFLAFRGEQGGGKFTQGCDATGGGEKASKAGVEGGFGGGVATEGPGEGVKEALEVLAEGALLIGKISLEAGFFWLETPNGPEQSGSEGWRAQ